MAKRATPPVPPRRAVTADRAARLFRLVNLLGEQPHTRAALLRKLKLDIRGFYRDLELVRDSGVDVTFADQKYVLNDPAEEALGRLPFPDPGLTLREAEQLARGQTAVHQRLRAQIESLVGTPTDRKRPKPKPTRRR